MREIEAQRIPLDVVTRPIDLKPGVPVNPVQERVRKMRENFNAYVTGEPPPHPKM